MDPGSLVLASKSPRRAELLRQICLDFTTTSADIDESVHAGETANSYVERMARLKALACAGTDRITLAADTIVVVDSQILGKPRDAQDGVRMLLQLSNRIHEVMTAVTVSNGTRLEAVTVVTRVEFIKISRALAQRYWTSGEGVDKAGGYGIQGIGGIFAKRLEGSYSAVVGLPLAETERMLTRFKVDTWRCRN